MKRCPKCRRDYYDESLLYCLDDGVRLLDGPAPDRGVPSSELPTRNIVGSFDPAQTAILNTPTPVTAAPDVRRDLPAKWTAAGVLLIIIVGASGFYFYRRSDPDRKAIKSIAVLPLANLSGDPDQEYFADGVTEAVIGNLSQIGSIKVISRTSVMKFRNSTKTIPEIAQEIGVDGVVEGTVQRSGDRIRVTAQLIDVATDSPVWSRSFERQMSDILKLESDIAQALTSEIRAQLTPAEKLRIDKAKTIDPLATEAFLLGKHYYNTSTRDGERQAVEQYKKALSIDPNYADAWAGLSDAWTSRAILGDISAHQAEQPTREAAQKALELDPQNSAANVSMCFIQVNYEFDWAAGENSCKRGIQLDTNNARAHIAYAYLLARLERWDEMSEQMQNAIRLDPVEPSLPSIYGAFLTQARRFDDAEKYLKRAVEIDPNYRLAYFNLARLYNEQGKFDDALAMNEKKGFDLPLATALIYARNGDRRKALEILDRSPKDNLYELALLYSALGHLDNAFEVINRSLDQGNGFMFGYGTWLDLDPLKADPRWKDVRRRMNLPV